MSKFDAMALAVDKPSRMIIRIPSQNGLGEPLCNLSGEPAWIDLLSDDSQTAQQFDDSRNDRHVERRLNGRSLSVSSSETRKQQVERYALLTVGWHLVSILEDRETIDVPFTYANVVEYYSMNGVQWVLDQVVAHVNRRVNFMPAKSGDSSPSPSTNSA